MAMNAAAAQQAALAAMGMNMTSMGGMGAGAMGAGMSAGVPPPPPPPAIGGIPAPPPPPGPLAGGFGAFKLPDLGGSSTFNVNQITGQSSYGVPAAQAHPHRKINEAKSEYVCLLCKRVFPNLDKLERHEEVSKLHQENIAALEREKERGHRY